MGQKRLTKETFRVTCAAFAVLFLFAGVLSFSQSQPAQPKPLTVQCSTQGTSTQSGNLTSIVIRINEYSSEQDRKVLMEAFSKAGSAGLFNAVKKMPSKGRVSLSGGKGYDLKFIRLLPDSTEGIRKIRIVTDRPIAVAESISHVRSLDYNLTAIDLTLDMSNVKDKSTGVLIPACELVIDKKTNELNIKAYQNPWKLFNFFGLKEEK